MSAASGHYDMDRFGAGLPRFSPRQADVLLVVGTVSHKIAPILRRVYDQMCEPKWVVAFGVCTCTGGFYDNYATVQGIDTILPVDIYIPGCPPRPEAVLDGLMKLQTKIENQKQVLVRESMISAAGNRETKSMLLNIGPSHPAMHGVIRLITELGGRNGRRCRGRNRISPPCI